MEEKKLQGVPGKSWQRGGESSFPYLPQGTALTMEDSSVTPPLGSGRVKTDSGKCSKMFRKTVWRVLKKLEIELPYAPAITALGIHTRNQN